MNKYKKLVISIVLDALGCVSYFAPLPVAGEFTDIIWAPLSSWIMTKLYKGKAGKVGALVNFIEEAFPGLDIIPTFTIMWFYTYVFSKEKKIVEIK